MMAKKKSRSIGRQVIVNFCLFAVLISAAFGFMSFMFLFTVEDEFLDRELRQERDRIVESFEQNGEWSEPVLKHMQLYFSSADLPEDLREQFLTESIRRKEFYGQEGRHYHISRLNDGVILVAEVSDKLLIRPWRNVILATYSTILLIMTAIGCIIAFRLARRSIKPLTNLAEMVKGAAPEKLPEDFADSYPRNEVGTLADALQGSLGRIKSFIKREQQFNRDVSHDLRTPIAVVSGAVEVLQKRHKLDKEVNNLVHRIDVANKHMGRTVEALLSLAREEDSSRLKEPHKVLPIVEKTILQFGHFLDHKEVEIDIDINPAATLETQPGVLEILLSNLLGNAFEYTEHGHVSVKLDSSQLTITDTAGGVDEAVRDQMFTENVKGRDSSGFGLGLSIVKRVCEHHNVAIAVEHKANGTSIALNF